METKQVQKASKLHRRNGYYLVKDDDNKIIGTISRPYNWKNHFIAETKFNCKTENCSTKDLAESFIIQEHLNHQQELDALPY